MVEYTSEIKFKTSDIKDIRAVVVDKLGFDVEDGLEEPTKFEKLKISLGGEKLYKGVRIIGDLKILWSLTINRSECVLRFKCDLYIYSLGDILTSMNKLTK